MYVELKKIASDETVVGYFDDPELPVLYQFGEDPDNFVGTPFLRRDFSSTEEMVAAVKSYVRRENRPLARRDWDAQERATSLFRYGRYIAHCENRDWRGGKLRRRALREGGGFSVFFTRTQETHNFPTLEEAVSFLERSEEPAAKVMLMRAEGRLLKWLDSGYKETLAKWRSEGLPVVVTATHAAQPRDEEEAAAWLLTEQPNVEVSEYMGRKLSTQHRNSTNDGTGFAPVSHYSGGPWMEGGLMCIHRGHLHVGMVQDATSHHYHYCRITAAIAEAAIRYLKK